MWIFEFLSHIFLLKSKDGISLDITSPDPDPWAIWYAIALPNGVDVSRYGEEVKQGFGYISGNILGQSVIIVKSEGTRDSLRIKWSVN